MPRRSQWLRSFLLTEIINPLTPVKFGFVMRDEEQYVRPATNGAETNSTAAIQLRARGPKPTPQPTENTVSYGNRDHKLL